MKKKSHELSPIVSKDLVADMQIKEYQTRVKHSVNPGDLYAAIEALKRYYDITGRKIIVSQTIGMIANYYANAQHPTLNESGQHVCVNEYMFNMMKPLIESQEYIHSFEKYEGQSIHLDFDVIRGKTFVNLPHGPIQGWIPIAFPDLSFDLSKAWITLDDNCPEKIKKQVKGKIILNFTERYRVSLIDYYFLKKYSPELIFAGTEKEHWLFCNQWGLTIPRLEIGNFLELGYAVKEAKFTLCNQSQLWNLCEAMKVPRILEMCSFADNCFPNIGGNSEGYMYQTGLEYHFKVFYNKLCN